MLEKFPRRLTKSGRNDNPPPRHDSFKVEIQLLLRYVIACCTCILSVVFPCCTYVLGVVLHVVPMF